MANHLVIGLGGTGGSVLRALRKRIYEEFRSNDPKGSANIEYLYVDSSLADLNNEEDWQTLGVSVQLSPAQRLSINGIGAGVLSNLDQYPGINSFINRKDEAMLKEGIGAIISEGIGGQRRRFGRMLIANNMCGLPQNTFVGQVHARVRALKEKEDVDDVTFHICAGLGGGTGSGSLRFVMNSSVRETTALNLRFNFTFMYRKRLSRFRVGKTATAIISRMDMLPCWN